MLISQFMFVGLVVGFALGVYTAFRWMRDDIEDFFKTIVGGTLFGVLAALVCFGVYMLALTTGWF